METKYPSRNSGHKDSFKEGESFQDFCIDLFADRLNFIIQQYTTKKYQYEKGESRQGVEIKLDNRHTDTKRLSIEIAEKKLGTDIDWRPSGIYSHTNNLFYIVGNYQSVFLFSNKFLIQLHNTNRYDEATHPKEYPTIKKYYLPLAEAEKYCITRLMNNI